MSSHCRQKALSNSGTSASGFHPAEGISLPRGQDAARQTCLTEGAGSGNKDSAERCTKKYRLFRT